MRENIVGGILIIEQTRAVVKDEKVDPDQLDQGVTTSPLPPYYIWNTRLSRFTKLNERSFN